MVLILDGKIRSAEVLKSLKSEVEELKLFPKLSIVLVGDNPASEIYIRNKLLKSKEVRISCDVIRLSPDASLSEILEQIDLLNADDSVNGIIVQSPLPDQKMWAAVANRISPNKDVDGFSDTNVAKLVKGDRTGFVSCTPLGIYDLLRSYDIEISGKHVVIIGRSGIVGRPLSLLLSMANSDYNATVTLCHSHTKDLEKITKLADIVVVAIGRQNFLKDHMVKSGVVVVDVGINRQVVDEDRNYKITGDVDFESVRDRCFAISPVPGGVGPMTVAMLMSNTIQAAKLQSKL